MINEKLREINLIHHPDGQFISGGAMDEASYSESPIKMMMLMKEVNDPDSKYNWSLPSLFQSMFDNKCTFYRMWKNVSRWTLCSRNPDLCFVEISNEELVKGLGLFSTSNLKKTGGSGGSKYDDILTHARKYQEEWIEEVNVLDPHLVVCAGTFDVVCDVLGTYNSIQYLKSGAKYFLFQDRIFLDFVHPAYRISDTVMYAYFKESMKCILEDQIIIY